MKIQYLTFDLDLEGQGYTKCCPVPSTSCDFSATKFEVAAITSNRLGRNTFTSKYIT